MQLTGLAKHFESVARRLRAAGCVFAEDEAYMLIGEAASVAALDEMVRRRCEGEPIEYILGWAEFCGIRVGVEAGVFVPRARSEFLVRLAARVTRPGAAVLDLGCGSGALGLALAKAIDGVRLIACDIEPRAVACARRNLAGTGGTVYEGDLYEALPSGLAGTVEVMLVNAPYVPTGSIRLMPAEARLYEPPVSLDGGADGLEAQRRVANGATHWLAPGGYVFMETSKQQAKETLKILGAEGLKVYVERDEATDATVVVAIKPT